MSLGVYIGRVLTQDVPLSGLVGARVYSDILPQRPELPAVVFTVVSEARGEMLFGPESVGTSRVQITCVAKTRAEAGAVGAAVDAVLSGHSGAAAGYVVQGIFPAGVIWEFDEETAEFLEIRDYEVTAGQA